jgi:hypothetical protein
MADAASVCVVDPPESGKVVPFRSLQRLGSTGMRTRAKRISFSNTTLVALLTSALGVTAALLPAFALGSSPSIEAGMRLDRKHEEKGIDCTACHASISIDKSVSAVACVGCHGSYEIIFRKSRIHEAMISPHFPGGNGCGQCHKVHGNSELICGRCHDMEMCVP